jgi:hypothetical protein
MLSTLLRFIILPILVLLIGLYAALPWWLPVAVPYLPYQQLFNGLQISEVKLSHPLPNEWQIQELKLSHINPEHDIQLGINNMHFKYDLLELWRGGKPDIAIDEVNFDSHLAAGRMDAAAILMLLPQRWLLQMPASLNIERVKGQIQSPDTPLSQAFSIFGKFNADQQQANVLAKLTSMDSGDLFLEANFEANNAISATLFTKQQSAPVAKLTSQMRDLGDELNWQGQMALNVPVVQKLLASQIPAQFALPVEQGRLISHWQIMVPRDQQQSLADWLDAAYGEHQFQLQLQTNTKVANDINLDANITHTLTQHGDSLWQINSGSLLDLQPNWQHFNLTEASIADLGIKDMQIRLRAQSPVDLSLQSEDKLKPQQQTLFLDGSLNATMQAPNGNYQIFSQLQNLAYTNTDKWQGKADISGYYVLPRQHPVLEQLPLGIQQVQAVATVNVAMTPATWQIEVAPNSKLSANQVESQQQKNQVLLFANDRLNLTNADTLQLSYHTANNQWQWNDMQLSLQPQTATGTEQAQSQALGLQIELPAGRSQFDHRPSQGFFKLNAQDTRLIGWPSFDLLGEGQFTFGGQQINIDFTGQGLPYTPILTAHMDWDFQQQQGLLSTKARQIDLLRLQNTQQINWPITASTGSMNYQGQWQWRTSQQGPMNSQHDFSFINVSGSNDELFVEDANGHIRLQQKQKQLLGEYQLGAQNLGLKQYASDVNLNHAKFTMHSTTPLGKGLAKALANPDELVLNSLSGEFFGGSVSYQPEQIQWQLQQVNMQPLADKLLPGLRAQGSLSGQVKTNDQWRITEIDLATAQTAQLHLMQPLDTQQTGASTFNALLNNMHVDSLEITSAQQAESSATMDMPVNVRLRGHSEQFNGGQPVDLNLTLKADLSSLLSLQ